MFSYPSGVITAVEALRGCTMQSAQGGLDPPRTLGVATAMVAMSEPTLEVSAVPGARVPPATVAATSTSIPDTYSAAVDVAGPAVLPVEPENSKPSPHPDSGARLGGHAESPHFDGLDLKGLLGAEKAKGQNDPSVDDPPNINNVPANNGPLNTEPTRTSPIDHAAPNVGHSTEDPSINGPHDGNPDLQIPATNDPAAGNAFQANNALYSVHDASENNPSNPSLGLPPINPLSPSPPHQAQNHNQNQNPNQNQYGNQEANSIPSFPNPLTTPSPNLAAHIASALGYMPDVTATPLSAANPDPTPLGIVKTSELAPLLNYLGGAIPKAIPQATNAAVVLAPDYTIATALGDPSGNAIAVNGENGDSGRDDGVGTNEGSVHHFIGSSISGVVLPEISGIETMEQAIKATPLHNTKTTGLGAKDADSAKAVSNLNSPAGSNPTSDPNSSPTSSSDSNSTSDPNFPSSQISSTNTNPPSLSSLPSPLSTGATGQVGVINTPGSGSAVGTSDVDASGGASASVKCRIRLSFPVLWLLSLIMILARCV